MLNMGTTRGQNVCLISIISPCGERTLDAFQSKWPRGPQLPTVEGDHDHLIVSDAHRQLKCY